LKSVSGKGDLVNAEGSFASDFGQRQIAAGSTVSPLKKKKNQNPRKAKSSTLNSTQLTHKIKVIITLLHHRPCPKKKTFVFPSLFFVFSTFHLSSGCACVRKLKENDFSAMEFNLTELCIFHIKQKNVNN